MTKITVITDITDPDEIKDLPWSGNFLMDRSLFALVDKYIDNEPDEGRRARAEMLVSWYGMGIA